MKRYIISIDIGTIGTKAAIYDIYGKLYSDAYYELPIIYTKPGWVEQNPEDFYRTAASAVREALKKAKIDPQDVAVIGIDGQMGGFLPVDKDGKSLSPFQVPFDSRANNYVDWMIKNYADVIWKTTGNAITGYFHAPKIMWIKDNDPDLFQKTYKFVWANTYVNLKLTGAIESAFAVDYTMLPATMLYDYKKLNWSKKLCDLFEIPLDKLPTVVRPWEVIGYLAEKAAKNFGLKKDIPIIAGAGDFVASLLGAGAVKPGHVIDVCGTANVLACCTDRPVPDVKYKTLECWKSVLPDQWIIMGCLTMGSNLRWFRDELSGIVKQEAESRGISPYKILDEKAAKIPPGSGGLLFIPHLAGRRDPWWPNVKGVWFGLRWEHKMENLYRAMLESAAFEYYYYSTLMREYGIKFNEVRVVGGGAKSELWNQIKADVLNVDYITLLREEGAVMGTAVIAGYGVSLFKNIADTISEWVKVAGRTQPRLKYHEFYLRYYKIYEELHDNLYTLFNKLAEVVNIAPPN